jgi:nicotinate phosphoribosyltransferase
VQCQLLETALLTIVNFQTLIATKAARICWAAQGAPVVEFGLRRAQGIDGGLGASRAAYIGGCEGTSNVLAGKLYGIPVRGTHAHSWVMAFDTEEEAFAGYAAVLPNNCVFLVDTYDTLAGVEHAIAVGRRLREQGHEMVGIRLDSGDLAHLSIAARRLLDEAGFPNAKILATNDLDERIIESLHAQGAKIGVWGVGTKLATAYDQPALGGVYKLGAIRNEAGSWEPKVKLSEQPAKTTIPGILQVRRCQLDDGSPIDVIFDETRGIDPRRIAIHPQIPTRRWRVSADSEGRDLLAPVVRAGRIVAGRDSLATIRQRVATEIGHLPPGVLRFLNPHEYPIGMDVALHELRDEMIQAAHSQEK